MMCLQRSRQKRKSKEQLASGEEIAEANNSLGLRRVRAITIGADCREGQDNKRG